MVSSEPVVITSAGKPVMALVNLENTDLETFSLSTNPEFMEIIRGSRVRHEKEGGVSADELRRRLEI